MLEEIRQGYVLCIILRSRAVGRIIKLMPSVVTVVTNSMEIDTDFVINRALIGSVV